VCSAAPHTSLTIGCPFFHVEGPVANGCLAGSTGEAMHMPGHLQGVHDLLGATVTPSGSASPPRTQDTALCPRPFPSKYHIYISMAPRAPPVWPQTCHVQNLAPSFPTLNLPLPQMMVTVPSHLLCPSSLFSHTLHQAHQ
jgi:hypothetical protein